MSLVLDLIKDPAEGTARLLFVRKISGEWELRECTTDPELSPLSWKKIWDKLDEMRGKGADFVLMDHVLNNPYEQPSVVRWGK